LGGGRGGSETMEGVPLRGPLHGGDEKVGDLFISVDKEGGEIIRGQ